MSRPRLKMDDQDLQDGITYDIHGGMEYHPEFHFNHGKPFTLDEMIYLCKFYEIDGQRKMSYALGRVEHSVKTKVCELRKSGRFEVLKNLTEDEWSEMINDHSKED